MLEGWRGGCSHSITALLCGTVDSLRNFLGSALFQHQIWQRVSLSDCYGHFTPSLGALFQEPRVLKGKQQNNLSSSVTFFGGATEGPVSQPHSYPALKFYKIAIAVLSLDY